MTRTGRGRRARTVTRGGWSIDEGFRKVHFRAGRNRVLVRLENGWHGLGYSVCLYLGGDDNPAL